MFRTNDPARDVIAYATAAQIFRLLLFALHDHRQDSGESRAGIEALANLFCKRIGESNAPLPSRDSIKATCRAILNIKE